MDLNVVAAGAGRSVRLGDDAELVVKEDGSCTRGSLMVAEMTIQPGFAGPAQHLHHAHEESWFVLEGAVELVSGTRVTRIQTGDWGLVPIGVPHTFSNPGEVPARFLAIMTPNLYLNYFIELSEEIDRMRQEGRDGDEWERTTAGLMAKYQTETVDHERWPVLRLPITAGRRHLLRRSAPPAGRKDQSQRRRAWRVLRRPERAQPGDHHASLWERRVTPL